MSKPGNGQVHVAGFHFFIIFINFIFKFSPCLAGADQGEPTLLEASISLACSDDHQLYNRPFHLKVRNVVMKCDIIITSSVWFLIIFMRLITRMMNNAQD